VTLVVNLLALVGAGALVVLVLVVPIGWLDGRRRQREARRRRQARPGYLPFAGDKDGG
jgi:hypothetical protein